ncbi:MAG: hypothetical protein ABIU87_01025 [Ornithinibacter sp.]
MRLPAVPIVCAALLLAACGSQTPQPGADDAGATPTGPTSTALPETVPAAQGPVTGQGTVIEAADRTPELCLGPIRESYPPQCEGVPLSGWDWGSAGVHEEAGTGAAVTRWGTYAVTGTFDGITLTVTRSVPLALYDALAPASPRPVAPPTFSEEQWTAVESRSREFPGVLSVDRADPAGPVHVTVIHDDGSLQVAAADLFGPGAVLLTSALR